MDAVMTRVSPEPPSVVNAYSDGSVHVDTRAVRCPVLVVGPQEDRTPVHDARRIAELYGVRPLLVPEVGHSMMLEDEASTSLRPSFSGWTPTAPDKSGRLAEAHTADRPAVSGRLGSPRCTGARSVALPAGHGRSSAVLSGDFLSDGPLSGR